MKKRLIAAMTAVLVAAPVVGTPAAAQAAVPVAAQTYAKLMYRSLTADAAMAKLRGTLGQQRAALTKQTAAVTTATTANGGAQRRLINATSAHKTVHQRLGYAEKSLAEAKAALSRASKQRPHSRSAVTRATKAVTAATKARDLRRTRLQQAAVTLRDARGDARTAARVLRTVVAAQQATTTAIAQTERRIAGAGTAAGYAGQAAAISRTVVAETRPVFTTADTTTVYGVTVHRNVAYAFKRMIDDARADGVVLSGGGFRTKQRQIELRKINGCPDVWTAPADSCRVPTAIPGRSLHEIGLAVDVTSGGRTLTRKSKAFTWMVANAGRYGFVNLPSEAWHWSITGG